MTWNEKSGASVFEAENIFLGPSVAQFATDDFFDVRGIGAQTLQDLLLVFQTHFGLGNATTAFGLDRLEAAILFPRFDKIESARETDAHDQRKIKGGNKATQVHKGDVLDQTRRPAL